MLDIKLFYSHPDIIREGLGRRGVGAELNAVLELNERRKKLQLEFDNLRSGQNEKSRGIAALKKDGRDASAILDAMRDMAVRVKEIGARQAEAEEELKRFALTLPNIPHESVPQGTGAGDNKLVREWGNKPSFAFPPREHGELGEALGLLDFDRAAKISGARFAILKGPLAKLERALIAFMLDVHTRENGYEEILPPFLVNAETMTGTGQLPKFEEDAFKTTNGLYLIPTAEVPVTNLYRGEILNDPELPKKFVAYTPCFRSEAGSYGKDMKGLIRQHQFNKVELVRITRPEDSYSAHEQLTADAEKILARLCLPYRVMLLCSGDMGFSAAKTYDIEVWLPGQNTYREISSCSNCEAFQARRMNTRFRRAGAKAPEYVHTLNGSGLAVGRTLIAILENYQRADGTIGIPEVLRDYMGGSDSL